jgi:hypothetical protein
VGVAAGVRILAVEEIYVWCTCLEDMLGVNSAAKARRGNYG